MLIDWCVYPKVGRSQCNQYLGINKTPTVIDRYAVRLSHLTETSRSPHRASSDVSERARPVSKRQFIDCLEGPGSLHIKIMDTNVLSDEANIQSVWPRRHKLLSPVRRCGATPKKSSTGISFFVQQSGVSLELPKASMKVRSLRQSISNLHLRSVGNIASIVVMDVFMARFGLDELSDDQYANTKGWIVSIATAGAVFGCLGCISLTQRWGRRTTMVVGTVVYMAGIFGQTFCAPSLGGLYASRFVAGLGIGVTTVLPSVYISEVRT